jgi:superfamily II DNA/RNA helicase
MVCILPLFVSDRQGKTAVFVLSTLHQLADEQASDNVLSLVLVHTRELVAQIHKEFDRLKKYLPGIRVHSACGSVPIAQDAKAIKSTKPHVLISTPGRALKLAEQKAVNLSHLKHFILDECDILVETLGRSIYSLF